MIIWLVLLQLSLIFDFFFFLLPTTLPQRNAAALIFLHRNGRWPRTHSHLCSTSKKRKQLVRLQWVLLVFPFGDQRGLILQICPLFGFKPG